MSQVAGPDPSGITARFIHSYSLRSRSLPEKTAIQDVFGKSLETIKTTSRNGAAPSRHVHWWRLKCKSTRFHRNLREMVGLIVGLNCFKMVPIFRRETPTSGSEFVFPFQTLHGGSGTLHRKNRAGRASRRSRFGRSKMPTVPGDQIMELGANHVEVS